MADSGDRPAVYDSLDGQVALVTGATRGIGAAIAAELTALGATVYAGARDTDDVTAADQRAVRLDVTDESEIAAAVDRIDTEAGRLDIVVNNAGIFPRESTLAEMDLGAFDRAMAVNLRGPAAVTKHALPLLLERPGGRVVNVSSDLGQQATLGGSYPAYRLSKIALGGLTQYLHAEYAEAGLLANAASPGWVRTDMGGSEAPRSPAEGADTPVWLARFRPESPGGRFWKDRESQPW